MRTILTILLVLIAIPSFVGANDYQMYYEDGSDEFELERDKEVFATQSEDDEEEQSGDGKYNVYEDDEFEADDGGFVEDQYGSRKKKRKKKRKVSKKKKRKKKKRKVARKKKRKKKKRKKKRRLASKKNSFNGTKMCYVSRKSDVVTKNLSMVVEIPLIKGNGRAPGSIKQFSSNKFKVYKKIDAKDGSTSLVLEIPASALAD